MPFAACPAGMWGRVELTCPECGSVTFNANGVIACKACGFRPVRNVSLPYIPKMKHEDPLPATRPYAVVTIAVGQKALSLLQMTGPRMQAYAERCGADFHAITDDQHPSYPLGNKWRLKELVVNYERILFLDVDIWLRDEAKSLFELCEPGRVWMHCDLPELKSIDWVKGESELSAKQQHVAPIDLQVLNTGVVLFDRKHRHIWHAPRMPAPKRHLTEQTHVEYEIHRLGIEVGHLPTKYNTQWWMPRFAELEPDAEFVHLANCPHEERIYRFKKYQHAERYFAPVGKPASIDSFRSHDYPKKHEVALITTHFNPTQSVRRRETYYEWLPTLGPLAESVRCYELVLDDDEPEIEGSVVIRGSRAMNAAWQKEALINRAMFDASAETKYIAWLDHDFIFGEPDWLTRAIDKIKRGASAVQLFSRAKYLDENRLVEFAIDGSMAQLLDGRSIKQCNPGGPWLADALWLRRVGLWDRSIVGGGDQAFFAAVAGTDWLSEPGSNDSMQTAVAGWIRQATELVGDRKADYIRGDVYHLYHGNLENRFYQDRHAILERHAFDPLADIGLNTDGMLSWASHKPELHADVLAYFNDRREDL